ncbi:MAG: BLUF domain-containing protein [Oxalobacteraceae bacterium]|nr:MAG: BLUF domain-containing protein [Oxalobacteraceae bacterium]
MSESIYKLVYYSRNHAAEDAEAFAVAINDILARSRVNNLRDGITGALMFNGGRFAQVLEGPLETVEAAFERIQQDERHGEVSLLTLEPVTTRSFPNWAMGFVGASGADSAIFARVGEASGFDPARFNGDQLHTLLRDLAIEEERLAA